MAQYEYKILEWQMGYRAKIDKELNDAGLRGWKVVGTGGGGSGDNYNGERHYQCWAILMREV